MTGWAEVSTDPVDAVLDQAVTAQLNAVGARAGLAPLAWRLSAVQVTTYVGPPERQEALTRPHIKVSGTAPEPGIAREWARLFDLAEATNGPAGRLIFAGHPGRFVVEVSADA